MFVILPTKQLHVGYFLKQGQLPYYSTALPLVFVNEAHHALIAKTKSNHATRGHTFEGPTFLPHL